MRRYLPVAVASALALTTGCTSPAQEQPRSGGEVLAEVVEDLGSAGSVRVQGPTGYSSDTFDLHVQGNAAVGSTSIDADTHAPFVAIDGQGWLLPPDDYFIDLGASEEEAVPLRGRYVTLGSDDWRSLWPGSMTDVVALLPAADEVADEVEVGTLDGEDVWILRTGDGVRLTVDAGSPHHPVELLVPAEEGEGPWGDPEKRIRFSDVGERRDIDPPQDPVPADALGG